MGRGSPIGRFHILQGLPPLRYSEIKVCKLFLYLGEHTRVVQTFNGHNRRMTLLFSGWGLGGETSEYWQWMLRSYRIFADLLEISEATILGEKELEGALKLVSGDTILNLDSVLYHPGYYYLLAAHCTRQRWSKSIGTNV